MTDGPICAKPNSKGQVLAYQRAYESSKVPPEKIDYIECHATGTPLGDKVELDSMEQFFASPDLPEGKKIKPLIGSAKIKLGSYADCSREWAE
jgi:Polyketide synthase modules and related proteins